MSQLSMAGINVFLAMPTHRDLPVQTVRSLCETLVELTRRNIPCVMQWQEGSSRVTAARSKAAHEFLQTDCSRLFWIDSDISWRAEDFIRLLALSSKLECVGGIYTAKRDPPVFMFDPGDHERVLGNEFGCLSVKGFGLGFTVVHRCIIEHLADEAPKVTFPDIDGPAARIFREDVFEGLDRGEDMAFFADVRAAGFEVWLDPSITLGHVGPKEYSASLLNHLERKEDGEKVKEAA